MFWGKSLFLTFFPVKCNMFAHNFVSKSDYLTKNIIQVMLYYFHSILHVTEFPDTLSYVARTMSDKRSFEQLFCHLLKVLCIQETFAEMSRHCHCPLQHFIFSSSLGTFLLVSPIIFLRLSTQSSDQRSATSW